MLLESLDGTRFELTPLAYQFPQLSGENDHHWDANWLVIHGDLELVDGRTHAFTDPCLTTWEALRLADWLTNVAAGTPLVDEDGETDYAPLEPCIRMHHQDDGTGTGTEITIALYLSLEAAPPFVPETEKGIGRYAVWFHLRPSDVTAAAQRLKQELAAFPVRGEAKY